MSDVCQENQTRRCKLCLWSEQVPTSLSAAHLPHQLSCPCRGGCRRNVRWREERSGPFAALTSSSEKQSWKRCQPMVQRLKAHRVFLIRFWKAWHVCARGVRLTVFPFQTHIYCEQMAGGIAPLSGQRLKTDSVHGPALRTWELGTEALKGAYLMSPAPIFQSHAMTPRPSRSPRLAGRKRFSSLQRRDTGTGLGRPF